MELKCGSKRIIFDLEPGIYSAWGESASGKTYTCLLLNALIEIGYKDILVITYNTDTANSQSNTIELLKNNKYSLIFADRADLYITKELYDLLDNSGAIVYLDCKQSSENCHLCGLDCVMEMTENEIKYYADDI